MFSSPEAIVIEQRAYERLMITETDIDIKGIMENIKRSGFEGLPLNQYAEFLMIEEVVDMPTSERNTQSLKKIIEKYKESDRLCCRLFLEFYGNNFSSVAT